MADGNTNNKQDGAEETSVLLMSIVESIMCFNTEAGAKLAGSSVFNESQVSAAGSSSQNASSQELLDLSWHVLNPAICMKVDMPV